MVLLITVNETYKCIVSFHNVASLVKYRSVEAYLDATISDKE
jgi:hypothetical protein